MSDERRVEARDAFRLCSRALRCERSTTHMSCLAARRCAAGWVPEPDVRGAELLEAAAGVAAMAG